MTGMNYKDCFTLSGLQASKVGEPIAFQVGHKWSLLDGKVNVAKDVDVLQFKQKKDPLNAPLLIYQHKKVYYVETKKGDDVRVPNEVIELGTFQTKVVAIVKVPTTLMIEYNGVETYMIGYYGTSLDKSVMLFFGFKPLMEEFDVLTIQANVVEEQRKYPAYSHETNNPTYDEFPNLSEYSQGGGVEDVEDFEAQYGVEEGRVRYNDYVKRAAEELKERDELIAKLIEEQRISNAKLQELKDGGFSSGVKKVPEKRLSIVRGRFTQEEKKVEITPKTYKLYECMTPDSPEYNMSKAIYEAELRGETVKAKFSVPKLEEVDKTVEQEGFKFDSKTMSFSAPTEKQARFG